MFYFYIYILSFVWLVRTAKAILFWLYLWQLKEYHIGRFLDHFRTEKGKRLIINNKRLIFKGLLALVLAAGFFLFGSESLFRPLFVSGISLYLFQFFVGISFLLLILYILEALHAFFSFFQKKIKRPVWTVKTILLASVALGLEILFMVVLALYLSNEIGEINFVLTAFYLLLFDIFAPLITSAIVLFFQPLTVLLRNQISKKAKRKREKFKNLLVIGITGSYGKTSTKEFLATILSQKYNVLKTPGHQNTEIGISRCILQQLKPEHQIFVVEMGAYNKGEIKLLSDITRPKIGVITGVNEQHLATFGSMENLLSAEGGKELIDSLPEDGIVFFNGKNKYCRDLYEKTKIKKFLYGQNIKTAGMENIEGAKMVARELGVSEQEIKRACQKIENKFPGVQLEKGIGNATVIDATFSANPNSVIAHLDYLKLWPGKKIIIMPCLIELGPASKRVHRSIGRKIAEVCQLAIITTKERFGELKKGASENGMRQKNMLFLENAKAILEKLKTVLTERDNSDSVILLEGRVPPQLISAVIK